MYKLIVAGGRNFSNYTLLKETLFSNFPFEDIEIVSGTANGADKLGERFAREFKYPIKRFPANWNEYGKSAGYIRNSEMANYADGCICFWGGESKGTFHMIEIATRKGLDLIVVRY